MAKGLLMEDKIKAVENDLEECKESVNNEILMLRAEIDLIRKDTAEILSFFKNSKGFLKGSTWIGKGVIFVAAVTGAVAAIRAFIRGYF